MATRRDRRKYGLYAKDIRKGGLGTGTPGPIPTIKELDTWLSINGTNIANSNTYMTFKDTDLHRVVSFTRLVSLTSGDYVELMFAVNDLAIQLEAIAATGHGPATPSITLSIVKVA